LVPLVALSNGAETTIILLYIAVTGSCCITGGKLHGALYARPRPLDRHGSRRSGAALPWQLGNPARLVLQRRVWYEPDISGTRTSGL